MSEYSRNSEAFTAYYYTHEPEGCKCIEIRCHFNNGEEKDFGHCNLKCTPRRRGYNTCIIAETIQSEDNQ